MMFELVDDLGLEINPLTVLFENIHPKDINYGGKATLRDENLHEYFIYQGNQIENMYNAYFFHISGADRLNYDGNGNFDKDDELYNQVNELLKQKADVYDIKYKIYIIYDLTINFYSVLLY